MFDAMKLLGALLENQAAPSAAGRIGAAVQHGAGTGSWQDMLGQLTGGGGLQGGGAGGGLGGLLGGLLGGQASGQSGGGLGQMGKDPVDQRQMDQGQMGQAPMGQAQMGQAQMGQAQMGQGGGLGDLLGGLAGMLTGGGAAQQGGMGGGTLGSLAGALLGGGRGAMGGSMMAVLAGLAQTALQNHRSSAAAPLQSGFADGGRTDGGRTYEGGEKGSDKRGAASPVQALNDPAVAQRRALLILRSMIQAAKADGQIDQNEMQRISGKLDEAGEGHEARNFVMQEMAGPADIEGLRREADTPQEAVEVYAAALMAIEVDTRAEQDYLARLAQALGLAPGLVQQIH